MSCDRVGFIGAGRMARALARGIVKSGQSVAQAIIAHDTAVESGQDFLHDVPGARLLDSNRELIEQSDIVFLAVKPRDFEGVARELVSVPKADKLMISILAGVRLATLCQQLATRRVVRVMPNTPSLIGCGAAAYALGPDASPTDSQRVSALLQSVGMVVELGEDQLDAVTGLAGSGPAYVYTFIEALSDGGVRAGLSRETAVRLAAQTVLGAAQMVLTTSQHPAVLREQVTSPGGTTIAGLQVLERRGLRSALIDAVEAATKRSQELGQT